MSTTDNSLHRIFFNITSACNLYCHYCYANSRKMVDRDLLPIGLIESIASEGKECGANSVLLSGGEPFFRKDWYQVFSVFNDLDYELAISSNGVLIDEKVVEKLGDLKNVIFQISLDGSERTVDKITGVKGTFKRVTRSIDRLLEAGYNVQINSVLHKDNFQDIPFLIRYSYEKRVVLRLTFLSTDYGRAKRNPRNLHLEQINKIIKAIHVARTANPYIELNIPPLLLHPDDWFSISPSCGWTHHQCGILSNGDVTICGLSLERPDLIAGNVKSQSFKDIWHNSSLFKKLRSLDVKSIKGVCNICPFLTACGGSCRLTPYVSTGDYYAPSHLCQMFYDALKYKQIEADDFSSGVLSIGLMQIE